MYFFVFRMSTAVCKFERFSSMHVLKSGIERLSITRQKKFLTKCRCGVVFWNYIEINFFLNGRIKLVCTQMTCQNQINVLTVCMIGKVICIWWIRFSANQICFFFRILREVSDPWWWTKGSQLLGTRLAWPRTRGWCACADIRSDADSGCCHINQNTTKWRLVSLHRNIFIAISDFSKSLRSFFSFGHLTGILSVLGITSTL